MKAEGFYYFISEHFFRLRWWTPYMKIERKNVFISIKTYNIQVYIDCQSA